MEKPKSHQIKASEAAADPGEIPASPETRGVKGPRLDSRI